MRHIDDGFVHVLGRLAAYIIRISIIPPVQTPNFNKGRDAGYSLWTGARLNRS